MLNQEKASQENDPFRKYYPYPHRKDAHRRPDLRLYSRSPCPGRRRPELYDNGGISPCFEMVWVNGVQIKMTFVHAPFLSTPRATIDPFYVVAPQTDVPQGGPVPFFHDHVVGDAPQQNLGDFSVVLHGFLVFCSAEGISSGRCVPTFTSSPQGILPFAKTVNGQILTSADPIESPANSGLIVLVDTGALILGTINPNT